jgi:hypothetical protein
MTRIASGVFLVLFGLVGFADTGSRQAQRVPLPVVKVERGEACVAPVEEMRRDHMKMLFHQRDRTMREGVRTTQFSLKGCVECHASTKTGSVQGEEGFCSSCHAYASVKIDCFECHTPMRQTKAAARP